MAKNQNTTVNSQSQGTCRKIFKVFKRRVPPARPSTPGSISGARAQDQPELEPSTAKASATKKVLVEYNHSQSMKNPTENNMPTKKNQGPKGVKFQDYNNNSTNPTSNEKFTDFIDNVKNKIKASSSFIADDNGATTATKRTTTRRESFNDRVSHFINRAKLKIRTTTMVGGSGGGGDHVQGDGKYGGKYVRR